MGNKKDNSLKELLKKNMSKPQLWGYAIANVVGLTIILAGILFYCDSRHSLNPADKFFSEDYIVVSKKVKGLNSEKAVISEEEIKDIERQPWVKKTGRFTSGRFPVYASVDMGGRGMGTYLFFEAVPDEFFDTLPAEWNFLPGQNFIPLVLNKDYLALYNFGFAAPQGLPQLSEEVISNIPLKIRIPGKDGREYSYDAAIVGFSSRLNTIAVPQDFLDWANARYGNSDPKEQSTSRLIIQTDSNRGASMEEYLRERGLEIAGDKEGAAKMSAFVGVVSGVVAAYGFVISLLALFILILSIYLLLEKSRQTIRNLLLLGYVPKEVSKYYERTVLLTNSLITSVAVGLTFVCRSVWTPPLKSLGLGEANVLYMLGAALIYFLIITGINISVIRRRIYLIWGHFRPAASR